MTKKEKRILVIKDVLATLDTRIINYGSYGEFGAVCELEDDLQEKLDVIEKKCSVCAIGSCFLSFVKKYDTIKLKDIAKEYWVDLERLLLPLRKLFSIQQLALIEAAFEGAKQSVSDYTPYTTSFIKKVDKAKRFHKQVGATTNLKNIMLNMLENDGVFVP